MGWYYHFNFFVEGKQINEEFVQNLVEILQCAGCVYREESGGYWSNEKDDIVWERPLAEAIEITYKQGGGSIHTWHKDETCFSLYIYLNKLGMLEVTISIDRVYLAGVHGADHDIKNARNANTLLNICEKLYDFLHPFYGYADHENERPDDEELISKNIRYVYWVNFFSPELVQKIGRGKLLSAPSWKTEELKDGGILLMLGPTPYDFRIGREEVERHLGFKNNFNNRHYEIV